MLKLLLRDSLRLICMHAPLITYVGETPFPKVFNIVSHFQHFVADDDSDCDPN